jgi:oxygen-independent coproporphyrinogen-3 oxidase
VHDAGEARRAAESALMIFGNVNFDLMFALPRQTLDDARRAAESALMIFGNVNLDLMYALPGQRVEDAARDAGSALSFAPPHLSFYQLTLEPNTLFHRHPPTLPDDETAADIEDEVLAMLARAGYAHYETSAHARAGARCRHNVNYWRFGDYLGIGAGAHSKLSFPNRVVRELRWKQPKRYLEAVAEGRPVQQSTEVARDELPYEFMLNALRVTEGVPASLFYERTGLPLSVIARPLADATRKGLLEADPMLLRPTPLGRRFLNDLQELFLADEKVGSDSTLPAKTGQFACGWGEGAGDPTF